MKAFRNFAAISTIALTIAVSGSAFAQHDDHHDDHGGDQRGNGGYQHHDDWQRGHRMAPSDWQRGEHIDYRERHLPPPRRGYEWRQVDGNYVMAAGATGLIASVIVASSHH